MHCSENYGCVIKSLDYLSHMSKKGVFDRWEAPEEVKIIFCPKYFPYSKYIGLAMSWFWGNSIVKKLPFQLCYYMCCVMYAGKWEMKGRVNFILLFISYKNTYKKWHWNKDPKKKCLAANFIFTLLILALSKEV